MKIFISYARKDKEFVEWLIPLLKNAGCTPWFDKEIKGGTEWWETITKNILDCDRFIFIISKDSIWSEICPVERKYAINLGKKIIPINLDGSDSPSDINHISYIDDDKDNRSNIFANIVNALSLKEDLKKDTPDVSVPKLPLSDNPLGNIDLILENNELSDEAIDTILSTLKRVINKNSTTSESAGKLIDKIIKRGDDIPPETIVEIRELKDRFQEKLIPPVNKNPESFHKPIKILLGCITAILCISFFVAVGIVINHLSISKDNVIVETLVPTSEIVTHIPNPSEVPETDMYDPTPTHFIHSPNPISLANLDRLDLRRYTTLPEHSVALHSLAFSETHQLIVISGSQPIAKIWNWQTRQLEGELGRQVHTAAISDAVFHPDGQRVITASRDGTARLWTLEGQEIFSYKTKNGKSIYSIALSSDGLFLAIGTDGLVEIWNVNTRTRENELVVAGRINSLDFNDDNSLLLAGNSFGRIYAWNTPTFEKTIDSLITTSGYNPQINSVQFHTNGRYILVGTVIGVFVIDTESNTYSTNITFRGHVLHAEFSPDGSLVAIVTKKDDDISNNPHNNNGLYLWNWQLKRVEKERTDFNNPPSMILFHPYEPILVAGTQGSNSVVIWQLTPTSP